MSLLPTLLANVPGSALATHGHLFAAPAPVKVDFDLSVLVQIVLFGFFIVIMKPVLFEPLIKLFEERDKRTVGAREEARTMDEKAGVLVKKFDEEIEKVRQAANAERDRLRAETTAVEGEILSDAKRQSATIIANGRARIAEDVAKLRTDLEAARPALAEQIASKVLGREVRS